MISLGSSLTIDISFLTIGFSCETSPLPHKIKLSLRKLLNSPFVRSALLLLDGDRGQLAYQPRDLAFDFDFHQRHLDLGLKSILKLSLSETSHMEFRFAKLEAVRQLVRLDRFAVSNSTLGAQPLCHLRDLNMAESIL